LVWVHLELTLERDRLEVVVADLGDVDHPATRGADFGAARDRPGATFDDEEHPAYDVLAGRAVVEAEELDAGIAQRVLGILDPAGVKAGLVHELTALGAKQLAEDRRPMISLVALTRWLGGPCPRLARVSARSWGGWPSSLLLLLGFQGQMFKASDTLLNFFRLRRAIAMLAVL
jgi:hypothetical protein